MSSSCPKYVSPGDAEETDFIVVVFGSGADKGKGEVLRVVVVVVFDCVVDGVDGVDVVVTGFRVSTGEVLDGF